MSKKSPKKETNVAVLVALIGLAGTLIAAALSSPLLLKLLEKSSTETATPPRSAQRVFSEDFEDGTASGFGFANNEWKVEKDKSNTVLGVDSTSYSDEQFATATFGPTDFKNGVIEFRIKYEQIGGFYTIFRAHDDASYVFYLTPSQTILGYKDKAQNWSLTPISNNTVRGFSTQTGVWYTVRIEAQDTQITVSMDGNKLFTGDDSRLQSGGLEFVMDYGTKVLLDDVNVWSFDQ